MNGRRKPLRSRQFVTAVLPLNRHKHFIVYHYIPIPTLIILKTSPLSHVFTTTSSCRRCLEEIGQPRDLALREQLSHRLPLLVVLWIIHDTGLYDLSTREEVTAAPQRRTAVGAEVRRDGPAGIGGLSELLGCACWRQHGKTAGEYGGRDRG